VPAGDALWDATIADIVVACIFLWGCVVLARHAHGERLLGTGGGGSQKG